MVTSLAKPAEAEAPAVETVQRVQPPTRPMTCPRCETHLNIIYYEPECLPCGYVDYEHRPKSSVTKSVIGSGTRYILRYVGEFSDLSDTLTHVQVQRERNRVVFRVDCPFCDDPMTQTSLSGKRREAREERYKCVQGHRVSLTPWKTGSIGWK